MRGWRTSPVERGKWVLTNLLGVPPQPPPPNIPPLEEGGHDGKVLPLRERMEKHRKDPVCAGCHRLMDPIGFALENYDGTGKWRTMEEGRTIDASGTLFNGASIDGVVGLRREIAKRPEVFVGVLTGLAVGLVTGGIALFWQGDVRLGLVVGLALIINHTLACTSGAAIPFIMKSMGFDPAQSATIFATTVTDVVGFFGLFMLARMIMT